MLLKSLENVITWRGMNGEKQNVFRGDQQFPVGLTQTGGLSGELNWDEKVSTHPSQAGGSVPIQKAVHTCDYLHLPLG